MPTKCFMVKPSPNSDCYLWLRRYSRNSGPCPKKPGQYSYHDAWTPIGVIPNGFKRVLYSERYPSAALGKYGDHYVWVQNFTDYPNDDSRYPQQCECGYVFGPQDVYQNFTDLIWVADDGRSWPRRDLPPGAMYFENWLPSNMYWDNKADAHLIVILPNKIDWNIDSRANNCTMPNDRTHRCWIRTGEPPNVTAGKNGHTCAAGAGSILAGDYHGFLQNGYLT